MLLIQYTSFVKDYLASRSADTHADPSAEDRFLDLRKRFPAFTEFYAKFFYNFSRYPPLLREAKEIGDESLLMELQDLVDTAKEDDIPLPDICNSVLRKRAAPEPLTAPIEVAPVVVDAVPAPAPVQLLPPYDPLNCPKPQAKKRIRTDFIQNADRKSLQELAKLSGIPANLTVRKNCFFNYLYLVL